MIHSQLAQGRWFDFSLIEQLANIGCDVDRAIRWKNKGNHEYAYQAFERSLELFDLTVADKKTEVGLKKFCVHVSFGLITFCMIINMAQQMSYGIIIFLLSIMQQLCNEDYKL